MTVQLKNLSIINNNNKKHDDDNYKVELQTKYSKIYTIDSLLNYITRQAFKEN